MHSDKENPVTSAEPLADTLESSKESTLTWLMEMDRDEPEENLFKIDGKVTETTLSAYEAEVAARPMTRGRAGADDLDTYIAEEIVLSEEGDSSAPGAGADAEDEQAAFDGLMAIEFSRHTDENGEPAIAAVDDGSDILGLADEDDIGDAYLVVKRVVREEPVAAAPESGPDLAPTTEETASVSETVEHTEAVATGADESEEEAPLEPDALVAAADEPMLPIQDAGTEEAENDDLFAQAARLSASAQEESAQEEMAQELDQLVAEDAVAAYPQEPEAAALDDDALSLTCEDSIEIESGLEQPGDSEDREIAAIEQPLADDELLADLPVADVQSYVASVDAPQGEEAFDDYLIAGSDLAAGDLELEELSLELEAPVFSVDPELESDLDLHEDFVAMEGFDDDLMVAITPRVTNFMEEVNAAVSARLVSLGRPGNAVVADVSIATDSDTRAAAAAQGYEPVVAICGSIPAALEGLDTAQLDAVMLRLADAETGETCNRLFLDEPVTEADSASTPPVLSVVEPAGFGEDIFGEDLDVASTAEAWSPENDEIDAIFDDFGSDDFAVELEDVLVDEGAISFDTDTSLETLEVVSSADELVLPVDELSVDEQAAGDLPLAAAATDAADTSAEDDSVLLQVFEEDIFEAELSEEEELQGASAEDIDKLIEDLGSEVELPGEICGVEVEAFVDTSANEELVAAEAESTEPADVAIPKVAETAEDMSWCIPQGIEFHYSSPGSGEIFAEFLDAFIEEGSSELEKLEDAVSAWEASPADEQSYTQVTRILHTIKGIAKGVGLHFYGTLIHNFETLLERMPRAATGEEHNYFRIVNAWLDAAVRGMDFVQDQRRDILSEFPGHVAEVPAQEDDIQEADAAAEVTSAEAAQPEPAPVQPAPVARPEKDQRRREEDKRLADEGARALAAQQSVRITSEKLDLLLNLSNQAQQLGVRTAQSTNRNKRATAELMGRLSSVRAHIADIADRTLFNAGAKGASRASDLDALEMDQYSELQEAANILREGVEDLADLIEVASRHNAQAEALLKQQSSVIGSIGSTIRAARVVPVSRLMPGLRRLVRTVSNDLGKDVAFRVANEVGTLDRDDYARCQTILEHMVRNALDHGIETTEERTAQGKPSVGQITVDVRMSGADSVIVLSDDGRGIDPDAMRESAIRKGLDVDAYSLSDDEARNLIFHKGFSTAQTLSQISGRGVGMDIVMSELQQMGGDIRIESEVGKGTSFHIRVPANVTVNGALLVTASDNSYAIPLGGLVAVDEVSVDDFFNAVENGDKLLMSGMECEPAYLGTLCQSGNLPDRASWRHNVPVIIAGSDARYMAIAIDDVEEALELVIRSLGAQFASVPGVAGAATTADGEAVVALDLNVLVSCFADGQGTLVAVDQPEEEKFLALVVDDSRTQRMVATSQLETVGIETATAENGAVAIDWLNTTEHLPDVILLDVEMPVKDGIQTLREIRKSARYSHIPVIMVTSRTGIKHRTMAEEAGCNGYMGKPFNFRMLIGQINELTGHRLELS